MRTLVLAVLALCSAAAAHAQSAWFDLPVPPAALALLDVGVQQGRALATQRAIRVLHSSPREAALSPHAAEFEQLLTDLDAFETQIQRAGTRGLSLAMASSSAERDVLQDTLEVLGFLLRERRGAYSVEPRRDDDAAALRKRLGSAGIDTASLEKRLNGGETVTLAPSVIVLPSPLPIETWTSVVFERPLPPRSVFSAIARDRQASLLLYGLQAMTPTTRAYVARNPELLRRFYRDHPGTVAAFGGSFRVDERGRVSVPGGAEAAELWEALVDEPLERADRFARVLFDRDAGRLAYFVDAITRLDAPRQRFALGLWIADPGIRLDRFRALYRTFVDVEPQWSVAVRPFSRPLYDPATLLGVVAVGPQGEPAAPAYRRLWARAFAGVDLPGPGDRVLGDVADEGVVDAAWLAERALPGVFVERRTLFERLMFGHRVFASAKEQELDDVLVALRGFGRFPALMLALERMGIRRPALFALVARQARQVEGVGDAVLAVQLLSQFQGALALLDRLALTGAIAPPRLDELVASLAALRMTDGRYLGALAVWVASDLVSSLPAAEREDDRPMETRLLSALADRAETSAPFQWEGASYTADVTAASRRDLVAIRAKQGGNSLDDLLALSGAATALSGEGLTLESVRTHTTSLTSSGARLVAGRAWPDAPDDVPDVQRILDRATRDLGRIRMPRDVSRAPRIVTPVLNLVDYLLSETLVALVYAPLLGDPEELLGPQADLSHRHRFGLTVRLGTPHVERYGWRRPTIDGASDAGLGYTGSLLGLDLALAREHLRRLSTDTIPTAPRLGSNLGEVVAQTLALMNPRDLTNDDLASIGNALVSGRERVRAAAGDPATLDELAAGVRMSDARRQLLAWTREQEPERVEPLFSLSELFRIGRREPLPERMNAWGSSFEPLSGCFCLRFPEAGAWDRLAGRAAGGQLGAVAATDLTLRVVEHLAALEVPAALATGVLAMAVQDYIDSAPPIYDDDWLGVVGHAQLVSRESIEDYVSALVAAGPVRAASTQESSK